MARKKIDTDKLMLQGKKTLKKPEEPTPVVKEEMDEAIEQIHGEVKTAPAQTKTPARKRRATKPKTPPQKEPVKRITFDIPDSVHMQIKLHCVRNRVPLKEFLLNSVLKEIGQLNK